MLKNLAFLFWAKNGQKSGSKFKKMAQKNQIGENGGERKINPSANPAKVCEAFSGLTSSATELCDVIHGRHESMTLSGR